MKMKMKNKILIIDDESSIRAFLKIALEADSFIVIEASSGEIGLSFLEKENFSLIILDHGLPGLNGLEVLKQIRKKSKVPVIFLTVKDDDNDKVLALDSGADDYLTKPFSVLELLARIRVALRHANETTLNGHNIIAFNQLEIDNDVHKIYFNKQDLKLTSTEYELLKLLIKKGEKLVPHSVILKEVWGPNSLEHHHYLRVYFGQIRKKLEKVCVGAGNIIENESGVGYRLKNISNNIFN